MFFQKLRGSISESDLAYIEEDLRSPCTQEIAVFRAFAQIVDNDQDEIVVIDTTPTGHTLLLLDSTQSYHREIERSQGDIPESVKKLLPKLRNHEDTEVLIVTLAEMTPVYEAERLETDLKRAGISANWWIINSSMYAANTRNTILNDKGRVELSGSVSAKWQPIDRLGMSVVLREEMYGSDWIPLIPAY